MQTLQGLHVSYATYEEDIYIYLMFKSYQMFCLLAKPIMAYWQCF